MFKVNKYREMEEFIAQFNKITGNGECAISMKYLTYFRWNVNEAAKAYLSMHGYGNAPSNDSDIEYKRYNKSFKNEFEKRKTIRNTERSSEPVCRNYRISRINREENCKSMKKSRSNNRFDDVEDRPRSKVRFNLDKSEELPKAIERKTFKMPRGILKFNKTDSSEVKEADEISPFEEKIHIYELTTRVSSNFSSEKEIPEFEKQNIFDNIFSLSQEPATLRETAQFGVQND